MNPLWILGVVLAVSCVRIENNGYKGIAVSLSKEIQQKTFDVVKLKDVLKKASEILYQATRRRSYFEEFIFVLPPSWSDSDVCDENATEVPKNVDIYVTDSSDVSDLTTQHSKGCRQRGEVIYLPKNWLTGTTEDLALKFVQQWSILRYGVFSENPETSRSCIVASDSTWSPTGCYNVDLKAKVHFNNEGLPQCDFPDKFNQNGNLSSSIMFSANSSKVVNFCDGEHFPHNPVAPTVHNRICKGDSVWSVITSTEDFLYGRNWPLKDAKPPNAPTFRCFKETKSHLTLIVQDTESKARTEIRYALFHFLSIIDPTDFSVTLATFSNDSLTEEAKSVELELQDKNGLKTVLDNHLKLNEEVPDICLTCGLRKAYEVSSTQEYSQRIIILLARESSLENIETSQMAQIMDTDTNVVLYFLFLEDTDQDIIPSSLVDAVQETGGRIFRLKNEAVFMLSELNVALLDASKNVLHLEDKILVMHKKSYVNVKSDITDVFLTPKRMKGKLLYSMQCKNRGDMRRVGNTCSDADPDLPSLICRSETDISGDENSAKIWRHSFKYYGGSDGTTCSSLALVKLESSSTSFSTLKGWLSENTITPGRNVLIIYAEIFGRTEQDFHVEARISGPGLNEFPLELRDNGNGDPDVIKGDNIYSRYFTAFSQKGTYTVSIYAQASSGAWNTYAEKKNPEDSAKPISLTKVVGSFRVTEPPPTEDILPPNRVADLKVISIDNGNRNILLQWTAPGDDYDNGTATKYVIKLSNNWMSLMDFTFNLKDNFLLEADGYKPSSSGETENVTIQCPLSNYNETYYIALQSVDDNDNKGKTSNIIQVHFKDAYFPPDDISTETSNLTDFSSTEESINNFTLPETKTTSDDNSTVIPSNETKAGIFIEKNIFIIAVSTTGAFVLILIVINIIVCCCCFKKKRLEEPKEISRKSSLSQPYNINMAYKHASETSLEEENEVVNSLNLNSVYSNSDESGQAERYTFHTSRSLQNKMDSQTGKNDLGFKLVKPMPAYATTSLSRFATRHRDTDDESEISNNRSNAMQLQRFSNDVVDAHVYSLGQV